MGIEVLVSGKGRSTVPQADGPSPGEACPLDMLAITNVSSLMRSTETTVFQAIADPTRRDLLLRLRGGERSTSELAQPFPVTRSAVSQHLGILLEAGLVERRRSGRRRLYSLRAEPLEQVQAWVQVFSDFWDDRLRDLGAWLDEEGS